MLSFFVNFETYKKFNIFQMLMNVQRELTNVPKKQTAPTLQDHITATALMAINGTGKIVQVTIFGFVLDSFGNSNNFQNVHKFLFSRKQYLKFP